MAKHAKRNFRVKEVAAVAASIGLVLGGAAGAHADTTPGPYSITSCTMSDGTTTSSTLVISMNEGDPTVNITAVADDPTKKVYEEVGYANKSTGVLTSVGSGTGVFPNYPPSSISSDDMVYRYFSASTALTNNFMAATHYFEYRFYATQGADTNNQTSDTSAGPLCVIRVAFTPAPRSTVTVAAGTGGTVDKSSAFAKTTDTINIYAYPDTGYTFSSWSCTNGTIASSSSASTTVSNITANTTCTATFRSSTSGGGGGGTGSGAKNYGQSDKTATSGDRSRTDVSGSFPGKKLSTLQ